MLALQKWPINEVLIVNHSSVFFLALDQIVTDEEGDVLGSFLLQLLRHLHPRTLGRLQLVELVTVEADRQSSVRDVIAPASNKNDGIPN